MKKIVFLTLFLAVLMPIKVLAEHYGHTEVHCWKTGKVERTRDWPKSIILNKGDKIVFKRSKLEKFETGVYTAWVVADIDNPEAAWKIMAFLNGRQEKNVYFFETADGQKKAIWLLGLDRDDFKSDRGFRVTMFNMGKRVRLSNIDFSDVPVLCPNGNCGWMNYDYSKNQ